MILLITQEAYCPLSSKHSCCCPIGGAGYFIPGWGYPVTGQRYPISSWGGTHPGVPPVRDPGPVTGVPHRKDMRPAEVLWDGDGVPPKKDMGPVEVLLDGDGYSLERTWDQWKYYRMEMGYLLWTDRHLWKQYLPIVLRTLVVTIIQHNTSARVEPSPLFTPESTIFEFQTRWKNVIHFLNITFVTMYYW